MKPETEKPGALAPAAKCQVHFPFYLVFTVEMYEANERGQLTPSLLSFPSLSVLINAYCAMTSYLVIPRF